MAQTGAPNPPRWSAEESFLELLTDTLETIDPSSRGQFLQRFFRSIAQIELTEAQSLDIWDQSLARKRELSESSGKKVGLQAALVDVLTSTGQLRLPILMEYEELRKLQINAATDPLTSLYNRRFFDDYFEKELNRSARYNHKLAYVILDLHRFKDANDKFGHQQGDELLQIVAATFRKSLRTSDYAFRIGGDEFALLLPQTDTEQAAALSRRLRAAYASSIEPLNLGIPLALDYGLAVYPEDGESKKILTGVADGRLYQQKNGVPGRGARGGCCCIQFRPGCGGSEAKNCASRSRHGFQRAFHGSAQDRRNQKSKYGTAKVGARFSVQYAGLCADRRGW